MGDHMENQNYMQPAPPQAPSGNGGTILCVISMILYFGVPLFTGIIKGIFSTGDISNTYETLYSILSLFSGASWIAAWVLVIVARVKYKNTFSLVLLIIYLVVLALLIIGTIILIVACASWLSSCQID